MENPHRHSWWVCSPIVGFALNRFRSSIFTYVEPMTYSWDHLLMLSAYFVISFSSHGCMNSACSLRITVRAYPVRVVSFRILANLLSRPCDALQSNGVEIIYRLCDCGLAEWWETCPCCTTIWRSAWVVLQMVYLKSILMQMCLGDVVRCRNISCSVSWTSSLCAEQSCSSKSRLVISIHVNCIVSIALWWFLLT